MEARGIDKGKDKEISRAVGSAPLESSFELHPPRDLTERRPLLEKIPI